MIYDKRGIGQSGGAYESSVPYNNLVNDALAGVAFHKQHRGIASSQTGIWGLSQGAYISAAAASRSADIGFIMAAGADVADGMMCYYRDNLFRKYGLLDKLRDVAGKAQLLQDTLPHHLQDESLLSSFAPGLIPRQTNTCIPRGAVFASQSSRCGDNWINTFPSAKAWRV